MDVIQRVIERVKKDELGFSTYASRSSDSVRLSREIDDVNVRLAYARDTDRIIHSDSYTRYIDKTQVFSEIENDNITRRILHVELVNKIGRTIGKALNLNVDLIEAICVGHDIGHAPLGHFGESVLNEISMDELGMIFSHNVQGVRTMMDVCNNGKGCNLSIQVLDGILCHNGLLTNDNYVPEKKSAASFWTSYEACYTDRLLLKTLVPMTLEGCVARYSDIIAYVGKDIEDAIKLGVFDRSMIPRDVQILLGDNNGTIVDVMVHDLICNSYESPCLRFSDEVYNSLLKLRRFNFEHIYNISSTDEWKELNRKRMKRLYQIYLNHVQEKKMDSPISGYLGTMSKEYLKQTSDKRKVIDFIAGMTDRYFFSQCLMLLGDEV